MEPLSDKDVADDLVKHIRAELSTSPPWGAAFNVLFESKPGVQQRVLTALRPPKVPGRPHRKLPDDIWLMGIDALKKELQQKADASGTKHRITDRAAITHALELGSRSGRRAGVPFDKNSDEGRAEINRVRDSVVRARHAAKSK